MLTPLAAFVVAALLCGLAFVVLRVMQRRGRPLDPDPGGYRDGWRTTAAFPDKLVHGLVGFALVALMWRLGVPAGPALVIVTVGGVGFEYANGYVSHDDILANVAGGFVAALAFGSLAAGPGWL